MKNYLAPLFMTAFLTMPASAQWDSDRHFIERYKAYDDEYNRTRVSRKRSVCEGYGHVWRNGRCISQRQNRYDNYRDQYPYDDYGD